MNIFFFSILCFFLSDVNLDDFKTFKIDQQEYYVKKTGGLVYKCVNDSLKRIDHSYDNKLHHLSLDFIYKNQIHRLGGYGYFHFHNLMVKFNEEERSWDNISIEGLESIEGFSHTDGFHFLKDDQLVFFGTKRGDKTDPLEGYQIDLRKNEIVSPLQLNIKFQKPTNFLPYNETYLILIYKKMNRLLIYNIENKKTIEYKISKTISNGLYLEKPIERIDNDVLINTKTINGDLFSYKINFDLMLNNSNPIDDSLYIPKTSMYSSPFIIGSSLTLPIIILVFWLFSRNRNKGFYFKNNELVFNNKVIVNQPDMILMIKLLLKKNPLLNSDLNDVLNYKDLNPIHLNRMKNQYINDLNLLLEGPTNCKDVIYKKKDVKDKRVINFYIRKEFFDK